MKHLLLQIMLCLFIYGCSKNENPVQAVQPTSLIGVWNIATMTIDDSVYNFDNQNLVIRIVEVKSDSSAQLYWYDKLTQTRIDTGQLSQKDTAIVVTVYSPSDSYTRYYKYEIGSVFTLYYRLPGITRKYVYIKDK